MKKIIIYKVIIMICIHLQKCIKNIFYFFSNKNSKNLVEIKNENIDTSLLEYHKIYPNTQGYI